MPAPTPCGWPPWQRPSFCSSRSRSSISGSTTRSSPPSSILSWAHDPNAHLNRVKEALKTLSEAGNRYLTQDAELGYRFLTETETRFEKIVAEQDVTDSDRFDVIKTAATGALKKKFAKVDFTGTHGKRKFEVKITLADSLTGTPTTLSSLEVTWS